MTKQDEFNAAINFSQISKLKLLINDENVDPSYNNNNAIRFSSENGHTEIVELLLNDKRIDPAYDNNWAIQSAIIDGYISIVELLLADERVDPSDEMNYALLLALDYKQNNIKQNNIFNLLWKDKRIKNTLKNDNLELYNNLTRTEIEKKVNLF